MDIYRHDDSFREKGFPVIAGIDEAGRGPLAGPVVAAAVILPPHVRIDGLRDSKKVPERERGHLFWEILIAATDIGIGIVGNEEIDRINILQATRVAMKLACEDLTSPPDALIIDAVTIPDVLLKQFPLIKADDKSAAVAAASIIAKHVRDMLMHHYDILYPEYLFRKHKGYCTREHMAKVAAFGPCPIHRRSFKQVMTAELPFPLP
jgi:ribonuclease HII